MEYLPIAVALGQADDTAPAEQLLSAHGVSCEVRGAELLLHLRELDFREFKRQAEALERDAAENQARVVRAVLDRIEAIRSYGFSRGKRLYVGYDRERKVRDRKAKERERGAYFYARDDGFSKADNPLPAEIADRIIVGDSEEVLARFPDNCIDLVLTSPPYNFGLDYENHRDGTPWDDYLAKLFGVFEHCIRVLKYGGRMVVNVQPLFSDYIPLHHMVSNFLMSRKMIWKGEILWDKHNWNCKYTAWGSWKSPSNPYLKYTWEFLEVFCKGALRKPGAARDADISADEFKRWVIARWDIAPERDMAEYGHPAMFPETLVERVLKLFSYRADIILDPFNGVGTTTAVAKRLGRRYVGIDVSAEYCARADERARGVIADAGSS